MIFNFMLFELAWLACAFAAANDLAWLAALVCLLAVGIHLGWCEQGARGHELQLLLCLAGMGLVWESVLTATGHTVYRGHSSALAPYWIVLMWAQFAITLNYSMAWLQQQLWLAAILGGIFGPLAFLGAEKLGAISLAKGNSTLVLLALGWALLMPACFLINRLLKQRQQRELLL
ncbi:MAG: DUF2878 domain-containing protein [Cellvibrionaceae bacterium]|nr:DUF2878 domain-containing protein [Cellvibrionaceae bacterium]MCV6626013.1 DUF2878 domain-containing protein [Cellvibrionaceae bacterium]